MLNFFGGSVNCLFFYNFVGFLWCNWVCLFVFDLDELVCNLLLCDFVFMLCMCCIFVCFDL